MELHGPDRIFVNKLLASQRWDILAFRSVDNQGVLHTNRLVGLPGETIAIDKGAIFINGTKQVPPTNVGNVQYDGDPRNPGNTFGPLTLKENEFFVLGDFSPFSFDSRTYGPVPQKNIVGVVDMIYWPWKRVRVFR